MFLMQNAAFATMKTLKPKVKMFSKISSLVFESNLIRIDGRNKPTGAVYLHIALRFI